jgi:hypothetical protein
MVRTAHRSRGILETSHAEPGAPFRIFRAAFSLFSLLTRTCFGLHPERRSDQSELVRVAGWPTDVRRPGIRGAGPGGRILSPPQTKLARLSSRIILCSRSKLGESIETGQQHLESLEEACD